MEKLKKGELLRPYLQFSFESLLCEAHRTCFADNGYLHLSRISHLVLNLLRDFTGQFSVCLSSILSAPTMTRSSRPAWMA